MKLTILVDNNTSFSFWDKNINWQNYNKWQSSDWHFAQWHGNSI